MMKLKRKINLTKGSRTNQKNEDLIRKNHAPKLRLNDEIIFFYKRARNKN